MNGQRAAALLADILKWRWQEWTPVTQVKAIRYDQDIVQGGDNHGLPFGLDQVIDTATGDGAQGVTTPEGIDAWLRFWNPRMCSWTNTAPTFREQPGAFFLQQLQENPVFTTVDYWGTDDNGNPDNYGQQCLNAWDEFCEELQTLHRKIARTTGNAPHKRGLCPKCKTGTMQQQPGPKGFNEVATCSNPTCSTTVDYSREETVASFRAVLRDPDLTDTWLTVDELRAVWPNLRLSTLRSWVRRQQVRKQGDAYNLGDINAWKLER